MSNSFTRKTFLTGGMGADVFKWSLTDASSSTVPVDTIKDWGTGNDKLDLLDLLQNEHANAESLDAYLDFELSGGNTTISIHSAGSGAIDQIIVLEGVQLTGTGTGTADQMIINSLLLNNKLMVDA